MQPKTCRNRLCQKPLDQTRIDEGAHYCDKVCRFREKSRRRSKRVAERKRLPNRCTATTANGTRCRRHAAKEFCYIHSVLDFPTERDSRTGRFVTGGAHAIV